MANVYPCDIRSHGTDKLGLGSNRGSIRERLLLPPRGLDSGGLASQLSLLFDKLVFPQHFLVRASTLVFCSIRSTIRGQRLDWVSIVHNPVLTPGFFFFCFGCIFRTCITFCICYYYFSSSFFSMYTKLCGIFFGLLFLCAL